MIYKRSHHSLKQNKALGNIIVKASTFLWLEILNSTNWERRICEISHKITDGTSECTLHYIWNQDMNIVCGFSPPFFFYKASQESARYLCHQTWELLGEASFWPWGKVHSMQGQKGRWLWVWKEDGAGRWETESTERVHFSRGSKEEETGAGLGSSKHRVKGTWWWWRLLLCGRLHTLKYRRFYFVQLWRAHLEHCLLTVLLQRKNDWFWVFWDFEQSVQHLVHCNASNRSLLVRLLIETNVRDVCSRRLKKLLAKYGGNSKKHEKQNKNEPSATLSRKLITEKLTYTRCYTCS